MGSDHDDKQSSAAQEPLELLCLIARIHGIAADPQLLQHQLALDEKSFPGFSSLKLAAKHLGLKARQEHVQAERLRFTPLPAIAKLADGSWAVIAAANGTHVVVQYPTGTNRPGPTQILLEEFYTLWTGRASTKDYPQPSSGELLLVASRASLIGDVSRFDFSWFIPSLVKHRKLLGEVLGASVFLQLFALITPLFFQVVMDKVLVHQGLSTLHVLVIGLIFVSIFESAMSYARTYVFAHTTSRIDVELGSRLFRHLLRLPLAWFQARRVGDSVARVRELETIEIF